MALKTKLGVAAATVAVGIVCSGASASPAAAAGDCSGDSTIGGAGATFQGKAQDQWRLNYNAGGSPFCGTGALKPPTTAIQAYDGIGSGAGLTRFQNRAPAAGTGAAAFAGSDQGPNADKVTAIQSGASGTADDGVIETIPVLAAAITTIVNVPDGCTPPSTDAQGRALITSANLQAAFAGTITNWGQLLGSTATTCTSKQIKRVVRRDSSGTTYEFKGWLFTKNNSQLAGTPPPPPATTGLSTWRDLQSQNTVWPQPSGSNLTVPTADGGGALATTVGSTDGSIGYVALPDARANGFTKTLSTDDTYWLSVEDGTSTSTARSYAEPSTNGVANTTKAASNCASTTYKDRDTGALPTTTQSNGAWSRVEGFNTATAGKYPICALSYDVAWDNAQTATSQTTTPFTSAQACTVRHFLGYALSSGAPTGLTGSGQSALTVLDYAALPSAVRTLAQAGQARIQNSTSNCAS